MPELDFQILEVKHARHAITPTLLFTLGVEQRGDPLPIRNIALQCQARIETRQRNYSASEQVRLDDLFGDPARWGESLQSMLWIQISAMVPAFDCKSTSIELTVPCSFDFNLAATKYFHGIEQGEAPLMFLFSGSVFYLNEEGALAMDAISWNQEAQFRMPVQVWKELMDGYYPNQTWLCLNRANFDALYEYKRTRGYLSFDEALSDLLQQTRKVAS